MNIKIYLRMFYLAVRILFFNVVLLCPSFINAYAATSSSATVQANGIFVAPAVWGNTWAIGGWACIMGSPNSINVTVYAGDPANGGIPVVSNFPANMSSGPAVASACQSTGTNYNFSIALPLNPSNMARYADKPIYVMALTPNNAANYSLAYLPANPAKPARPTFPSSLPTGAYGFVGGVGAYSNIYAVGGWACSLGDNNPISVQLYAGNPALGGKPIGSPVLANQVYGTDPQAIAADCMTTNANFGYGIVLDSDTIAQYGGQPIYVVGLSNNGNYTLVQSGNFDIPLNCGQVNGAYLPQLLSTDANLCSNGAVPSSFKLSGGKWTWLCNETLTDANPPMSTTYVSSCSANQVSGQSSDFSLSFAGQTRTGVIYSPANLDPKKHYPLIVVFHGMEGSGGGMERITGFDNVGSANGVFVVYPDAAANIPSSALLGNAMAATNCTSSGLTKNTDKKWNLEGVASGRTSVALCNSINDIGFTEALLQYIESRYNIDTTRIYTSGYSEGAGMAQDLVCSNPGQFAGVSDVSDNLNPGSEPLCNANLTQPITYVLFHGSADPVSPYNGGQSLAGGQGYSAQQTATDWATWDGCHSPGNDPYPIPVPNPLPNINPNSQNISDTLSNATLQKDVSTSWFNCNDNSTVSFYTITDGGHTWPGGAQSNDSVTQFNNTSSSPSSVALGPVSGLSASQIIWQKFKNSSSS